MKEQLLFSELIKDRGLDLNAPIKYVRHKTKDVSMYELIEKNLFEYYQCVQKEDVFNCKYIISFLGIESTKSLFWNVYEIIGKTNKSKINFPKEMPMELVTGDFAYEITTLKGFEDLHNRVVIEWGKGALSWCQNFNGNEKEVVEIRPKGFVKEFTGYLDFTLSFSELCAIFANIDSNKIWHVKLASVNGIYLILDKKTGKQYVGSAHGKDGIWGRWANYANNGHGGNKALEELCKVDNYANNFQWTVLQTLPSNLTNDEVIAYENMYKNKLGTRVEGLNRN